LDISVAENSRSIELNGKTIYPQQAMHQAIYVPQVQADISVNDIEAKPATYLSHPLRLESFSALASVMHSSETKEDAIRLELNIDRVEEKHVKVPHIVISASRDTKGQLTITKIEALDKTPGDNCATLFCRFRAIMESVSDKVQGKVIGGNRRPCPHHKGHSHKVHDKPHGKPNVSGFSYNMGDRKPSQEHVKAHHHKKPGHKHNTYHPRPQGHHYHHHHAPHYTKFDRFMHGFIRVLLTIVIPIAVGVIAGMLTYVLGMALGTVVAFIWMSFRTATTTYSRIDLDECYEDEIFYEYEGPEKDYEFNEEGFEAPPLYVETEAGEARK
jgi:hypothetical protein